jgi:hypothetical protein
MNPPATSAFRLRDRWRALWIDLLLMASLGTLAAVLLAISWRKWPDPLIDFGRELYLPWRISQGAVFGRDVESLYGPLSAYINAAVFTFVGPGIMKLVACNLAVYAGILVTAYAALRQGWGRLGAWSGSAFFVAVFSFLQLTPTANYNYATPYSHEATHGLLACLALLLVLLRWRRTGSVSAAALAGLLVGVTAVLKVECLATAVAVTVLAAGLNWREGRAIQARACGGFFAAALVPTVAFAVYFAQHMPWEVALETAGQTVVNVVKNARYTSEKVQLTFSGFDEPLKHLREHAFATGVALLLIGMIVAGANIAGRELERPYGWKWLGWATALALTVGGGLAGWWVGPHNPGFALLGLAVGVTAISAWNWERTRRGGAVDRAGEARLMLGSAGVLLMMRMPLAGRFYHYGFYQAAVAGMVVTAAVVADWPRLAGSRRARQIAVAAGLALAGTLAARQVDRSMGILSARTLEVGTGTERMVYFSPSSDAAGDVMRASVDFVHRKAAPGEKLLVLPEGVMINYLTRRQTPLATTHFFAGALIGGREAGLVRALGREPPPWVIVVSRDLREYGVSRYGESPGHGELLLRWVLANYTQVAALGGDPLDPNQRGARYFKFAGRTRAP